MSQTKHSYILRFEAENGKVVTATMEQMGDASERATKKIAQGAITADKGLNVLTRGILTRLIPAISAYKLATDTFQNIQAFEKLDNRLKFLTDSTEEYGRAQEFLRTKAKQLNIDLFTLADGYARLLALQKGGIITNDQTEGLLEGLANAKAALGATDAQIQQVLYGMGQGFSQVRLETTEFNQILDPLPGFINNIAKAAGVTAAELKQMVKDGQVSGQEFAVWSVQALKDFEGAAEGMDGTVTAALSDNKNAWKELAAELSKSGLKDFIVDVIGLLGRAVLGAKDLAIALKGLDPNSVDAADARIKQLQDGLSQRGYLRFNSMNRSANEAAYKAEIEKLQKRKAELAALDAAETTIATSDDNLRNYQDLINEREGRFYSKNPAPMPSKKPDAISEMADKRNREQVKEYEREAEAVRKVVEQLRTRYEEMELSEVQQEINNQLRQAGVDLYSAEGREIERYVRAIHESTEAKKRDEEITRMQADAIRELEGAYKDWGNYAVKVITEVAAAMVELSAGTGSGSGLGGLIANGIFGLLGSSTGGGGLQYAKNGLPLPAPSKPSSGLGSFFGLKLFSRGGISDTPAIFGDAGPEAAVPLPDGKNIPVKMIGQSSAAPQSNVTNYIDARGADEAAVQRLSNQLTSLGQRVERIDGTIERRAVAATNDKYNRSASYMR